MMKPLGILHLYRMRARSQIVQDGFAVIGIAVGVALLFSAQIANTSLNGSVRQLTSGLVGNSRFQLEARGAGGISEGLLGEVQRLRGVRGAAPELEVQANVLGPHGARSVDLIGADPRFVALGGSLLRHFGGAALARQHAVALPLPIAQQIGASVFEKIGLQVGARSTRTWLGATLQEGDVGALAYSPVALAPLAYAQRLTGMMGRISRIFVQPQAGREREVKAALLALAAGSLDVEPADYDAVLFDNAATPADESTALVAVISAMVGALFALNAMLLTAPARRALITDLQLVGYSPWTVIEVLLFDAFVLGLTASGLGLALGNEISLRLFNSNPGYLSFAFPVGSQRIVTWESVGLSVAGGMLAACGGVLVPLRNFLSSWRGVESRRLGFNRTATGLSALCGAGCLVVTVGVIVLSPQSAVLGVVALTMALLLLLPSLLRAVLAVVDRLTLDVKATAPFVAVNELRSPATWSRTVAVAATGAIAVFGSVAIDGTRRDLERGLDASARGIDSMADIWVTPAAASDSFATTPFSGVRADQLLRLAGVQSVSPYRGSFLDDDGRRVWILAPAATVLHPIAADQFVAGTFALASTRIREHGWAVVSRAIAAQHHFHIGQRFILPAPHPTTFRLAGLITNLGWPSGAIIINAADYAAAWGSTAVSAYQLTLSPGASSAEVTREVQHVLGSRSALVAEAAAGRERLHYREASQGLSRLSAIRNLVLVASILAMAAAMGSMVWQRRTRLAHLKLEGRSDPAVWRALLLESILLLGSGCSIGAAFGLVGQLLGSQAVLGDTGFPVVFVLGVSIAAGSCLLVSGVAVLIVAFPGYMAARVRPAASLSD